jgi:DNA-binding transcriptional ArsR family regulator
MMIISLLHSADIYLRVTKVYVRMSDTEFYSGEGPAGAAGDPVREIRDELRALRREVRNLAEGRGQPAVNSLIAAMQRECGKVAIDAHLESARAGLEQELDRTCPEREKCREILFREIRESAGTIANGRVTREALAVYHRRIRDLKTRAPPACTPCFEEATRILDKQEEIAGSLGILGDEEDDPSIGSIAVEETVKKVLEPAASIPRLGILMDLAAAPRTFSGLSETTGMRGGNLLFHLEKLEGAGLISQRHERGEYELTAPGYLVLRGIARISASLPGCGQKDESTDRKI